MDYFGRNAYSNVVKATDPCKVRIEDDDDEDDDDVDVDDCGGRGFQWSSLERKDGRVAGEGVEE